MRIADGIEMLVLESKVMGGVQLIHPVLLWDEETAILVDAGYPGQLPVIKDAVEKAGVPFEKLNKVIVTHQDLDHIGSLNALLDESAAKIEVLANEWEKPYIQGEKQLIKVTPEAIEKAVASLPEQVTAEWRKAFRAVLENPPKADVDTTVRDGERLPYCGGITVIDTPGHTPGHISLYHHASKTLIAADALVVENGQLNGPVPDYAVNIQTAIQSLTKLQHFDIERVICYHGGLYSGNASERIVQLAQQA